MHVTEQLIAINGAELWVAEQGVGIPLVLCNGGFGCCDYLGPVAAMVEDLARVVRWEPRGCGRSSPGRTAHPGTMLSDI